jgi:hypothetical protein
MCFGFEKALVFTFAVSIICIGIATFLDALRQFLAYRYIVVENSLQVQMSVMEMGDHHQ